MMRKLYVRRLVLEIVLDRPVDNKALNDCIRTAVLSCGGMLNPDDPMFGNVREVQVTNIKGIPTPRYEELTK